MASVFKLMLTQSPVGDMLRHVPKLQSLYATSVWQKKPNLFYGVFSTHAEALANIPASTSSGWNVDNLADSVAVERTQVQPSTYVAMFWIAKLLRPGSTLIDLGGGAGITYFAHTERAELPDGATWHVIEVPAIAERGSALASRRNAANLLFSTDFAALPKCDVFLSAGCIQYMENSVPGLLTAFAEKPENIIINKIPLTKGRAFWTLQSLGGSACPYQIFNEEDFLRYFADQGYDIADRWAVAELSCEIPFFSRRHIPEFAGIYFKKR